MLSLSIRLAKGAEFLLSYSMAIYLGYVGFAMYYLGGSKGGGIFSSGMSGTLYIYLFRLIFLLRAPSISGLINVNYFFCSGL